VNCPAGTKVHGLGGDLLNRQGQAFMVALFPGQPLTSAHLRAREDLIGTAFSWQARVIAICAT
jgi:hypothetical protein